MTQAGESSRRLWPQNGRSQDGRGAGVPSGQQDRRPRGGQHGRFLRVGVLCLGVLVVACAGKDHPRVGDTGYDRVSEAGYDAAHTKRLFTVGYQDIVEIYIEDVEIKALALAGLDRLSRLDPALETTVAGDHLRIAYDGERTGLLSLPRQDTADAWGGLTARALGFAREVSAGINTTTPEALYRTVFSGIVTELDTYSRYAGTEDARENRANRDGFGGIGVRIVTVEDGFRVTEVIADTPAAKAGLRTGDVIVAIDSTPARDLSETESKTALRGPVDSEVTLSIRRGTATRPAPAQIAVTRRHIVPPTVAFEAKDRAAYFRVTGFNQDTARTLRRALRKAHRDLGRDLAGYVLDLRGNPGGLLDQAVEVADLFLAGGRVVYTQGRHPDSHQVFESAAGDIGESKPLVVLVNGGSASASEIVAAALQDSRRAVVVGTTSFGKGTVQTVLRLPNQGELTLTWARFHAPSGYALSRHGVIPNLCTGGLVKAGAKTGAKTGTGAKTDAETAAIDPETLLARLRQRPTPTPAPETTTAETDLDIGESVCPRQRVKAAMDLDLAVRLLEDKSLYRSAATRTAAHLAQAGK